MKNSKHTKRALFASVLSMMLCIAMLVGSTFAWFTDSVASGQNKIVAGNLDVEFEYWDADAGKYVSAKNVSLFSEETKWEPGHTEIVYLKISNKGNLALKYQLSTVDTFEYKYAENSDGERIYLSDYLELGVVADKNAAEGTFATREEAREAVTDSVAYDSFTQARTLLPAADGGESADYLAFLVYMPETVGNKANYVGDEKNAPWIRFSLAVTATQVESETDSFGSDYDAGLPYPLADTGNVKTNGTLLLKALASEAPEYLLGGDADYYYGWSFNFRTNLNLNGRKLATTGQNALLCVENGGDLTITGNGTVDASKAKESNGTAVTVNEGGKLTIESGTFIGRNGCSCIFNDGGEIVIKGGLFRCDGVDADGNPFVLNQRDNSNGAITVYGGTFVNCDPSKTGTEPTGQNDNFVAPGYKVVSETKENGDVWYTVVSDPGAGTLVGSAVELKAALETAKDGDIISLTQDIELTTAIRSVGKNITLNAMGNTISGVPMYITGSEVTVKNAVFDNAKNAKESCVYLHNTGKFTFEGCTFANAKWDGIQMTGKTLAGSELIVNNCVFEKAGYRYIHVEPSTANVDIKVTITNNQFGENPSNDAIGLYYIRKDGITAYNNTFASEKPSIYICSETVTPSISQEEAIKMFTAKQ